MGDAENDEWEASTAHTYMYMYMYDIYDICSMPLLNYLGGEEWRELALCVFS